MGFVGTRWHGVCIPDLELGFCRQRSFQLGLDWADADLGLSGQPEIPLFLPTQWL